MHMNSGLAIASMLTAATALAFNRTIETITITQTSWSTITSTLACPAPTTVTVCSSQCPSPISVVANNANIVYETLSRYPAGQVLTIGGQVTTLTRPTILTVAETISNLVIAPDYATNVDYSAIATVTDIVYPSSLTVSSGQVVTCQTGVTTVVGNEVVLTNCPCTVQLTVFEITATATGSGAMPTALVPSSGYIVKIIYVYLIETVISESVTTITRTATTTLTTVQTQTGTATATITTTNVPRPTIVDVDRVTFLLEYDTTYDGRAINNLRKRQAISLPGISADLYRCLARCSTREECRAASFNEDTSSCILLSQFSTETRGNAPGSIFATVIFRPAVPNTSRSSSISIVPSSSAGSSSLGSSPTSMDSSSSTDLSLSASLRTSSPVSSMSSSSSPTVVPGVTASSVSSSSVLSSPTPQLSISRSSSVSYPISNSSTISKPPSSSVSSSSSVLLPTSDSSFTSPFLSPSSSLASSTTSSSTPTLTSSDTPVAPYTDCAIATDLWGYGPAQSYCSAAYPITTSTVLIDATITSIVTMSAPASTAFGDFTLPAVTAIETVETAVLTTLYVPSELTVTDTATE
jgi:hypothetical protein